MLRRARFFSFAAGFALLSTPSWAEPAGEANTAGGARQLAYGSPGLAGVPGRLVLSAERIVSISSWAWTIESSGATNGTLEGSGTNVGILWSAPSQVPGNAIAAINPFGTPRIALDVFVHGNVTVGGSFGFATIRRPCSR